ncbi:cell envelope integrity EipB family protein [Roseibium algae]|uniref:Cell envelope integrity EipB family protein n=1 Tax=Roseibium algae TaxID=3123038 RepID=A0ABU8TQP2_9HYPH
MLLRTRSALRTTCFQVVVMIAGTVPALASVDMDLVPHRAVYDMALGDADEAAGVVGVSGLIVYDFSGSACEGYSTSFRFVTEFQAPDGGSQVTDLRNSSYEGGSGESFQFLSKTYVGEKLVESVRGSAKQDGAVKAVSLKEPEERDFEIDPKALFPTMHMKGIIEAAKAGKSFMTSDVFDGSETGDKVYATTTVIGAGHKEPVPESDAPDAGKLALPPMNYWPVTVAYFDPAVSGEGEEMPLYQMSFLLYENGISRKISLNYGNFTINGAMREIELHEAEPCAK